MSESLLSELTWRGLVYDATPNLEEALKKPMTMYFGIDPTGADLHIGHLVGLLTVRRFAIAGHEVILLMGGGTALIGDPSGKDAERQMVERKVIEANKKSLKSQIVKFAGLKAETIMVDNVEWLGSTSVIEFLREAGKYMPISNMMSKESVKARMEREQGLSYAEFSYQLLQAFDYLELNERHGCNLQIGGSDQWGNILQGVDLIRRKKEIEVQAMAFPLVVDPKTGKKFGKTEQGAAIWLKKEKTHPFMMYQFLVNLDDKQAEELIKVFSFKERAEIEKILREWEKEKHNRLVQKELAYEVVEMVHGKEEADKARKVSEILFYKSEEELNEEDLRYASEVIPCKKMGKETPVEELLLSLGLVTSKAEAKRVVKQKGVEVKEYLNQYKLVRKGKKDYGMVIIK